MKFALALGLIGLSLLLLLLRETLECQITGRPRLQRFCRLLGRTPERVVAGPFLGAINPSRLFGCRLDLNLFIACDARATASKGAIIS